MRQSSLIVLAAAAIFTALAPLARGAPVTLQGNRLISAIKSNDYDAVAALLKGGAGVDGLAAQDEYGRPPLEVAAFVGDIEILKLLVAYKAKPDGHGRYGSTALQTACAGGQYHVASYLLDLGVNPNAQDNYGYTALMCAARRAQLELVKLLVAKGARTAVRNRDGHTALDLLKREGSTLPDAAEVAALLGGPMKHPPAAQ